MAIINRRIFYAKVGQSGPLVDHLREFGKMAAQYGATVKERLLTDYQSGRTDRVVWEWEVADLNELTSDVEIMGKPGAAEAFTQWERKMNDMILYAEVENWEVK